WVTGGESYVAALWLFRILGAALFGAAAGGIWRLFRTDGKTAIGGVVFLSFFLFDVKTIAYSVNGMETAFMIFFLALALMGLRQLPTGSWLTWSIACAGLAWTRPDSC